MQIRLLAGILGAGMVFAPLVLAGESAKKKNTGMSEDMREAIAFERAKDRADARQAQLEARHPSVFYNNNANRSDENSSTVQDKGPAPSKKE
jgi:hypothetical protein